MHKISKHEVDELQEMTLGFTPPSQAQESAATVCTRVVESSELNIGKRLPGHFQIQTNI